MEALGVIAGRVRKRPFLPHGRQIHQLQMQPASNVDLLSTFSALGSTLAVLRYYSMSSNIYIPPNF